KPRHDRIPGRGSLPSSVYQNKIRHKQNAGVYKDTVSTSPPLGRRLFLLAWGWSSRWFGGRGRMDRRTEQRIEKALATPRTRNASGQPRTLYRNPYFALLGPREVCYRG